MRQIYFKNLFPLFKKIKNKAESILQMNQENMNAANNRARRMAAKARRDMYFFLGLSAFIALLFMLFSNHWILKPIRRFIASTQEIRKGNLNLVIQVDTRDEIGQLSEAFNDMVASLRLFRRSDQLKLLRIQRSTQEAFKNLPAAIAIVDADGMIEIATAVGAQQFRTGSQHVDRAGALSLAGRNPAQPHEKSGLNPAVKKNMKSSSNSAITRKGSSNRG